MRSKNHTTLNDATKAYVDEHYELDWQVWKALNASAFQMARTVK